MTTLKRIAVYSGASHGNSPVYREAAQRVGTLLAQRGIGIVYGGGSVGLMGEVADAAMQAGGEVIGVIPEFLYRREVGHDGLSQLIRVESMHERKLKMYELADGILTLPGGFGTMEELFEMLTWAQLGLHQKPIGILNTNGFYDALLQLRETMHGSGFLHGDSYRLLLHDSQPEVLIDKMQQWHSDAFGGPMEIRHT